MKIQVEILKRYNDEIGHTYWVVDKSKVIEISTVKNTLTIQHAKDKMGELKLLLSPDQKIRVLEYHNDDSDVLRQPCKILYE